MEKCCCGNIVCFRATKDVSELFQKPCVSATNVSLAGNTVAETFYPMFPQQCSLASREPLFYSQDSQSMIFSHMSAAINFSIFQAAIKLSVSLLQLTCTAQFLGRN